MAITRPLPEDGSPAYATHWKTGQTTNQPVFREGQWWDRFAYERYRRTQARDRQRRRDNLTFRHFLSGQPTDPGL